MKLRALARAEEAITEELNTEELSRRRGSQPVRFGGNEAHALAVSEVATACAVSEHAAARALHDAADLDGPRWEVLEALEEGEISPEHARVILDQARTVPDDHADIFTRRALHATRTRHGRMRTPAELRTVLRRMREHLHPDTIQARTTAARRERSVWFTPEPDGMCTLGAYLPAETGLAIYNGLDHDARTAKAQAAETSAAETPATEASAREASITEEDPANTAAQALAQSAANTAAQADGTGNLHQGAPGADQRTFPQPSGTPAEPRTLAEHRTLAELRADALIQRLLGIPGLGNPDEPGTAPFQPTVVLTIPIGLAIGAASAAGTTAAEGTEAEGTAVTGSAAESSAVETTTAAGGSAAGGTAAGDGSSAAESTTAAGGSATAGTATAGTATDLTSVAELEGYGPIDAHTARRLAALAPSWHRLFTDPITGGSPRRRPHRLPATTGTPQIPQPPR